MSDRWKVYVGQSVVQYLMRTGAWNSPHSSPHAGVVKALRNARVTPQARLAVWLAGPEREQLRLLAHEMWDAALSGADPTVPPHQIGRDVQGAKAVLRWVGCEHEANASAPRRGQ